MKTFTDAAGRTWSITLTLGTAMTVKSKLGVDLLQPESGDPPLLTRLGTDEMLLGEVLCAMLEPQFDKHNVTPDDVRAAFDGQTLLAAQRAFYEELIDFFRGRGRNDRAKAVAKQMAMIDAAIAAAEAQIDQIDPTQIVEETMTHGAPRGGSPAASGSASKTSGG
ncbi:MAG: hypothetical protein GC159_12975 [Phycisphaera sp.]|nr:hypothetical protein [Phycisphaera sp.]